MTDRESDDDLGALLASLAGREPFEVDLSPADAEVTSDRVSVDTPAGWLAFDALPPEDYGAEHDRHEPDADVYVNMWFLEGYTVLHTQRGAGNEASHEFEVHAQRPAERALELEAHGIPERRAEIAALREEGLSYSEIVAATGKRGPNHRGDVSRHLQRYNEQLQNAHWLAENAPHLSLGRPTTDQDGPAASEGDERAPD